MRRVGGVVASTIALWATPRTASTAFERMMIERGDVRVVNEPWSRFYYYSADGPSDRFDEVLPGADPSSIRAALAPDGDRPTFFKDMAYHPAGHLEDELRRPGVVHTFIIREPARALASLARRWPDFTWDEAGYEAQVRAVDLATDVAGTPVIIDSDELRADPGALVHAWCEAVGLEHRPEAMTWDAGLPAELDLWEDWYDGASASTGFQPPSASPEPLLEDPWLVEAVGRARPLFDRLHAQRLGRDV